VTCTHIGIPSLKLEGPFQVKSEVRDARYGTPEGRGSFQTLISELGMSESSVGGCTYEIHVSSIPLHYVRGSL
jgi:hypothetical protein